MAPCSKLNILALLAISSAHAIHPVVKGKPQVLGIATDPRLNRDSCGSTRMQNRTFWTCRDTQNLDDDGNPTWQITSSTASWTKINKDGSPLIQPFLDGSKGLLMSGDNGLDNRNVYFPLQSGQCNNNTAGQCGDGWRYAIWPDSPPMVTSGWCFGPITAYTWILNQHINSDFSTDIDDPSVTLYRMDYDPGKATDENTFPRVSVVSGHFWEKDSIPYGVYGNIIRNRTAYLFGQPSNNNVALAKVPADFVEDKSKYEYWVGGAWTSNPPSKDDERAKIPNASAGGQGTYYYSNIWNSYVWIGQAGMSVSAEFYITTAPNPWGPWAEPKMFYSGENGSADLSAYTLQAHPHMVARGKNQIYLSYTKVDHKVGTDLDVYSTPLVLVEWE